MASPASIHAVKRLESLIPTSGEPMPGEATEAYKSVDELAYTISRLPMGTRRPVKVICAGAGFSGLSLAKEVESGRLPNVSLVVYEKNSSVGGTWFENRYPGCACDIPIHNYQFSWAPCPDFPSYYGARDDIQDYIERVADHHSLRKHIKTSHKVVGAKWIDERQVWQISVVATDGRELMTSNRHTREGESGTPRIEECDIFINATGCFNDWKWPDIPGRDTFCGRMLHSAVWPKNAQSSLTGKTVALIGNGSTGVQILPAILDDVAKVYVFIRSKTWITAPFVQKFAGPGGANLYFSEEQRQRWAENPEEYLAYRKEVESELNSRFRLYLKDSEDQKLAREFSINQMKEKLSGKPDIVDNLLPDFAIGCRRSTPGNGYLEALCSSKVEVVWGEIDSFVTDGIKSASGIIYPVETIICATGFNMSFCPRYSIQGRHGIDLQKKWAQNPECYLSVFAADMPNYFMYLGPGSPLGHGSVVSSLEQVTEYIAKFITKLQTQNYSSVVPKAHIPRAYKRQTLAWVEKTAWTSHCVSTYKNGRLDGPVIALHPGSRLQFFELLSNPRWEDFEWTSLCDDPDLGFAWMANGFTVDECDSSCMKDLTWFLPPVSVKDHIRLSPSSTVNGVKTNGEDVAPESVQSVALNGPEEVVVV